MEKTYTYTDAKTQAQASTQEQERPTIDEVRVRVIADDHDDVSWLGEYTDETHDWAICRGCGEYLIDVEKPGEEIEELQEEIYSLEEDMQIMDEEGRLNKKESDKMEGLIAEKEEKIKELSQHVHDCSMPNREYSYILPYAGGEKQGTPEYRKYGKQDFERLEGLNRGDWHFVGVQAEATVSRIMHTIPQSRRLETLTSSGLWGIESDAGDYLEEVKEQELEDLREHLIAFNVDMSNWDEMVEGIELEWE